MPAIPVPHFAAVPAGVSELRATILGCATPLAILRAARACRSQSYSDRARLAQGRVNPEKVASVEDRIVDLTMMEGVLVALSGAVEAATREDAQEAPHAP